MMKIKDLLPFNWKKEREIKRTGGGVQEFSQVAPFENKWPDFEDMTDRFFSGSLWPQAWASRGLTPKVNLSETDTELHVDIEMPGVDEKDIQVTLENGQLVVSGEKKHENKSKKDKIHRIESSYGYFERSIPVPEYAALEEAKAKYKKGVLHVTIKKDEQRIKGKNIPISVN